MLDTDAIKNQFLTITTQMMLPIALYTAAKLNIADVVGVKGANLETLSVVVNASPKMLYRLMRYLVAHNIFGLDDQGNYRLNAFSQYLCTDHPDSMKETLLIFNERAMHSFTHLLSTMQTNIPAYKTLYDTEYFGDLRSDTKAQAGYNNAMANYSKGEGDLITANYNFNHFESIADIGGGKSDLLSKIKHQYPNMNLTLYDQPQVIDHVKQTISSDIALVPGDFFEDINLTADCLILKRVLHDWDDAACVTILNNCRKRMKEDSTLLIIDAVIDCDNETQKKKLHSSTDASNLKLFNKILLSLDLQLLCLHGGIERTRVEFEDLFQQCDLAIQEVIPTAGMLSIIEVKLNNMATFKE